MGGGCLEGLCAPGSPNEFLGLPAVWHRLMLLTPNELTIFHRYHFIGTAYAYSFESQTTYKKIFCRVKFEIKRASDRFKNLRGLIRCEVRGDNLIIIGAE